MHKALNGWAYPSQALHRALRATVRSSALAFALPHSHEGSALPIPPSVCVLRQSNAALAARCPGCPDYTADTTDACVLSPCVPCVAIGCSTGPDSASRRPWSVRRGGVPERRQPSGEASNSSVAAHTGTHTARKWWQACDGVRGAHEGLPEGLGARVMYWKWWVCPPEFGPSKAREQDHFGLLCGERWGSLKLPCERFERGQTLHVIFQGFMDERQWVDPENLMPVTFCDDGVFMRLELFARTILTTASSDPRDKAGTHDQSSARRPVQTQCAIARAWRSIGPRAECALALPRIETITGKLQTAIKPDHENDCAKFKCGARSRITRRSACAPPWHLERDHHRIRNRPHARGERGERARESEQSQTPHQGQG